MKNAGLTRLNHWLVRNYTSKKEDYNGIKHWNLEIFRQSQYFRLYKKELRLLICKIVNSELEFSKERFDKYCMKNIEVIHEFVDNESLWAVF